MKSKYLFPAWCSVLGYILAIPGFILGYQNLINQYEIPGFGFKLREKNEFIQNAFENFTNELAIFLVVLGLLLIAFSSIKREDELTAKIRLDALYWSIVSYYLIYNLLYLLLRVTDEIPFIGDHILEINIFTPLIIFIFRFNYLRYAGRDHFLLSAPKFLPHQPFQVTGRILAISGLSAMTLIIVYAPFSFSKNIDLITFFFYLITMAGLLTWAFSKNRIEDEMVMQQRLESLQLSVYFHYLILLLSTLLFYSVAYLFIMIFAQFSLLLYFVIRMEYVKFRNKKIVDTFEGELSHEK